MMQRLTSRTFIILLMAAFVWMGCEDEEWADDEELERDGEPRLAEPGLSEEQEEFWSRLQDLCGQAFEGQVEEAPEEDDTFTDEELIVHVRQCDENTIHAPFHVGDDRSRTWVISRTEDGLRLKHDHRHDDGTEEEVTQYGGDTEDAGTAERQEFPADEYTAELIPEAETNVWGIEVVPGEQYVYTLRREGTDRRFRISFDLSEPVDPPPAPWGYEDTEPTHEGGE